MLCSIYLKVCKRPKISKGIWRIRSPLKSCAEVTHMLSKKIPELFLRGFCPAMMERNEEGSEEIGGDQNKWE